MKHWKIIGLVGAIAFGLVQCDPYQESKIELGEPAPADFTIEADTGMNSFILTAQSDEAFLFEWDLGNGATAKGKEVRVFYQLKGNYQVILTAFSQGGHSTASQVITVDQDAQLPCSGVIEALTDCSSKSWVLDPAGGALIVGPSDRSTIWWQADPQTTIDRPCSFDDEYIFYEDGTFEYKTNGDKWVDEEGGAPWPSDIGLPIGCADDSQWPAKYADWLSGTFDYIVSESAIDTTLTVNGTGAHLALYKAGNAGTVSTPQSSITYSIVGLTDTTLSVDIEMPDIGGYWQFNFVPK